MTDVVFIVHSDTYDGGWIDGVFDSRERAERYVADAAEHDRKNMEIQEWRINSVLSERD